MVLASRDDRRGRVTFPRYRASGGGADVRREESFGAGIATVATNLRLTRRARQGPCCARTCFARARDGCWSIGSFVMTGAGPASIAST